MSRQIQFPEVKADYRALKGGLDLVSPRISMDPGRCFDACNYEALTVGGYRRINGFERYDAQPSPTAAPYWTISATITGTLTVGATLTGGTSTATGRILVVSGTTIVLGRVVGTFASGEALKISGTTVATSTSVATQRGALAPSDDADWRLLSAADRRADIQQVPGSGPIRGVFVQNDTVYAFRDDGGGTHSILWKAVFGWVTVDFGQQMLVTQRRALTFQGITSITPGTPTVVTWTAHGLAAGDGIQFDNAVALPTGLAPFVTYYVVSPAANTFNIATTPGGTAITGTGSVVNFPGIYLVTSPGPLVGQTVYGATSGASGTVAAVVLRGGSWGGIDPTNFYCNVVFVPGSVTGTFGSREALHIGSVGGAVVAQNNTGANATITRAAGGSVETVQGNLTGSVGSKKTYGADGVNQAFEFDGTTYAPISTGMVTDTPNHVFEFRNYLFLAFGASVQFSGVGKPYAYSVVLGAGEIAVGDNVTGFALLAATQAGAALGIFTSGRHYTLYGTSASNFVMVPSNSSIGFQLGTIQNVGNNVYGLTGNGLQALTTTLNYGDFEYAALSFFIEPLMVARQGQGTASTTLKNKNQYRVFFSDGTGLMVGLTGEKLSGIMPLNYGKVVRCMTTTVLANQKEVTYFGSDDGYVYQDNVGTSFDGQPIEAWFRPAFNNLKSPRVRKQYRRGIFELVCDGYSQVNIGYDLGYANPDANPPAVSLDTKINQKLNVTGGGYWDQFNWEQFIWDTPVVNTADVSLDGTENNIAFIVYSNRAQDDSCTFQGVNLLYTPRRIVHSGS
jgi:hypothetical protein